MIAPQPAVPTKLVRPSASPRPAPEPASSGRLAAIVELAKLRISALALLTTAIGYGLAAGAAAMASLDFVLTLIGTTLCAVGANAANQLIEVPRDARMLRTRGRPLPTQAIDARTAALVVVLTSLLGVATLAAVTPLAALCGAATVVAYALIYTPLKPWTPWCTVIGAVPGAMPPVIGVAAATGELGPTAGWLFLILFLWQMPHFYAIAWLHRDDYARGGFPMLSVVDPSGGRTARQSVVFTVALVAATVGPATAGLASPVYGAIALSLGVASLIWVLRFARDRDARSARAVFLGSIAYLPALLAALAIFWNGGS